MAVTSLQLTYAEIRESVGMFASTARATASWSTDMTSDTLRIMRSGLRKAYYPPPQGPGQSAHQWSFLRPTTTLTTTAPQTSSTITVANGVATLAAGSWSSTAIHAWLVYGGKYYEVASRDSGSQLTLVDTSSDNDSAAGTTYQLLHYRYALPSDYESLAGPIYWSPDESLWNTPLERRSDAYLRHLYQDSVTDSWADEPKYFAIYPAPLDTTAVQAWYLMLWPTTSDAFHFKYRYNLQMSDLDGTNLYPPGGAQHSEMILEACLSEAELKLNDTEGPHTAKWRELLSASIQLDREINEADTLGVVPINSPGYGRQFPVNNNYVIYDGYALSDFQT